MPKNDAGSIALEYFSTGLNCAESVLLGVTKACGIESDCVPRVASGFGGGVARHGEICGALTGAVMAMGLRCGRERGEGVETRDALYAMVDQLLKSFAEKFKSVKCIDLTGCDLLTPEGKAKAKELDLHGSLCRKFVKFAANEAARLLAPSIK